MCYKKPGPRCASHLRKEIENVSREISDLKTNDTAEVSRLVNKKNKAIIEWWGTETGQKALQIKITELESKDDDVSQRMEDTIMQRMKDILIQRKTESLEQYETKKKNYHFSEQIKDNANKTKIYNKELKNAQKEFDNYSASYEQAIANDDVSSLYLKAEMLKTQRKLKKLQGLKNSGLVPEQLDKDYYGAIYELKSGGTNGYALIDSPHEEQGAVYARIIDVEGDNIHFEHGIVRPKNSFEPMDFIYAKRSYEDEIFGARKEVYDVRKYY